MNPWVDRLVKTIVDCGDASRDQIIGCSEAEISSLESEYGVKLPQVYKEFLSAMGNSPEGVFEGDAFWAYSSLADARSKANEGKRVTLKPTDFVFLCSPEHFLYFDTTAGDGATVRSISLVAGEPDNSWNSFTAWLQVVIEHRWQQQEEVKKLEAKQKKRSAKS